MKQVYLLAILALLATSNRAQAVISASTLMSVDVSATLNISVSPSAVGFGSYGMGAAGSLVTTPIVITNQPGALVCDIQISATSFGEPDGNWTLDAAVAGLPGQNEVQLEGVFVSAGASNAGGFIVFSDGADSDNDTITTAFVEARNGGTGGACSADAVSQYCIQNAVYPAQTPYFLGDGQNLSPGEAISLRLHFTPPASSTFDTVTVTSTLYITATAGGVEE
ncbi:MAG: hypothetical protein HY401_06110 [Elusimicrobia bacterium]|nr:hypothetical protein [Elusimicrobiota bacterium]